MSNIPPLDAPAPPCPVVFQDNHLIAVYKPAGVPVQGDSSGDPSLLARLQEWLKVAYAKPGNAYLGLIHRIDRPVQGLVLLAKTDKALRRMNEAMRERQVERVYLAVVEAPPPQQEGILTHHLVKNSQLNRSYAVAENSSGGKPARLHYRLIAASDRYFLVQVTLDTGRHHQIRAQLAAAGAVIRGDVKYGAARSLPGGGIDLLSWRMSFHHPVGDARMLQLQVELPGGGPWSYFAGIISPASSPANSALKG